ncbi:hypothetical protein DM02DRAFT_259697 [Periconia macrospinosa]|uniref:Uncharacterized protein n=1 Tax=Periconia macrospinosa TaxID=97972 RepID=A0A2V1D4D1_9PLEO|nr:hypothetical protein DM02DRAFT_259697 [Periconia macrospinosa]
MPTVAANSGGKNCQKHHVPSSTVVIKSAKWQGLRWWQQCSCEKVADPHRPRPCKRGDGL